MFALSLRSIPMWLGADTQAEKPVGRWSLTVDGWELGFVEGNDEPLMPDVELGKRLGYAAPRMVRKLINRWEPELGPLCQRSTVERYEVKPGQWHSQKVVE